MIMTLNFSQIGFLTCNLKFSRGTDAFALLTHEELKICKLISFKSCSSEYGLYHKILRFLWNEWKVSQPGSLLCYLEFEEINILFCTIKIARSIICYGLTFSNVVIYVMVHRYYYRLFFRPLYSLGEYIQVDNQTEHSGTTDSLLVQPIQPSKRLVEVRICSF